ncbi:ABC transporter ATP-binding protein [Flexivirga sp. ID2601S]|uniref:ABC transporter ATP-binding protein n=1 Tax=Flexivirga aerilata TaxID=1656889 RepID=A0A849AKI3_9MICO|nr:ABC transporter ATP-binding protein [Flexivirga aerilata]NNG40046.1 ABC transporter ATP-binding protein [Flexivirga aerilata]
MTDQILDAVDIRKRFHGPAGAVEVLDGVSLAVRSGEVVALVGRSGSGKSTLLNILGTLARPDGGRVTLGTTSCGDLSDAAAARLRRTRIGFVFQAGNLLPQLTARQNVALPYAAGIRAGRGPAADLLAGVGLADRLDHRPSQLSAGQQQRVALARALVNSPDLLLADEPTGSLDEETEVQMLDLLRTVAADGKAVLVVTHSDAVARSADRVLRIDAGHLVATESLS